MGKQGCAHIQKGDSGRHTTLAGLRILKSCWANVAKLFYMEFVNALN